MQTRLVQELTVVTDVVRVVVPRFAGVRNTARVAVADLPDTLNGVDVVADMSETKAVAPSFVDELIRQLLVDRGASSLELSGPTSRAIELATRFADNHDVGERLRVPAAPVS